MNEMLPETWHRVLQCVASAYGARALLAHGSRVPGWPEVPTSQSDYDVLAVGDDGGRERTRQPLWAGGPTVDLLLVSRRGLRTGQLLSPETHVILRYGTRVGDWAWLDATVRLAWAGADDAADDTRALLDAAEINAPDNPASVCRLAVEAVRKSLTLQSALGTLAEAPTWTLVVGRYALDAELVSRIRGHRLTDRDDEWADQWVRSCLRAARRAVKEAEDVARGYPRNESDLELASLVR